MIVARAIPLLCLAVLALAAGCATNTGEVPSSRTSEMLGAGEILLTRGPRQFLQSMESALSEADPGLVIADGTTFRDAAFPDGGWTLAEMLTPAARQRVRQPLSVDYLLLFGPLQHTHGDGGGTDTISLEMPVAAGVGQPEEESTLSGLIVDLATGNIVSQVDVTAAGSSAFAIWIIVAAGTDADSGENAMKGMSSARGTEIRGHSASSHPGIVLLAAEAARLWQPAGAGGWERIDPGDGGAPYYHVFGTCGLEDGQISLQQAFDRAMGLYQAEAWEAAYDCFGFVGEAGEDDSALAQEARQRRAFMRDNGLVEARGP